MKDYKLHHIGVAVKDINKALSKLEKIVEIRAVSDIVFDSAQNANLCMCELTDGSRIELVSGEVVKQLVKQGVNVYHTCYEVRNIDMELEEMQNNGAVIISNPTEAVLFDNRKVAFIKTAVGLMELLEK